MFRTWMELPSRKERLLAVDEFCNRYEIPIDNFFIHQLLKDIEEYINRTEFIRKYVEEKTKEDVGES